MKILTITGRLILTFGFLISTGGCKASTSPEQAQTPGVVQSSPPPVMIENATLVLAGGRLIDGSGAAPVENVVVVISGDHIAAVGPDDMVMTPEGVRRIDLQGKTILPGFINAHVHRGFNETNLKTWAHNGVTTVRDEGTSPEMVARLKTIQENTGKNPEYARLVSAGAMMGAPGGYGDLFVSSSEEARAAVLDELKKGVSLIKVSLEDGYAGSHDLPKLTPEELAIIVKTAHENGVPVSGHITQGAYIQPMLEAGVDDIAHLPWDDFPPESIAWMVEKDVYLTPTLTVFRNYDAPISSCVKNLRDFVKAGGRVALGNDFGGGPGDFEDGIPMYEIEKMSEAGMTPIQIITAATLNAARVSNLDDTLGTIAAGKTADILVVEGDPLKDLKALENIRLVVHNGVIIREE